MSGASRSEGRVVPESDKNSREAVRVSLTEFHGQELLGGRACCQAGAEWKPGKGLAVRREMIPTLRKALRTAEKAAKEGRATGPDAEGRSE